MAARRATMIFFHVCSELRQLWEFGATCVKDIVQHLASVGQTVWKMIGTFTFNSSSSVCARQTLRSDVVGGNRPVYKANGMISYLITLAFLVIVCVYGVLIRPHDNFSKILSSMNVLGPL
jgi:hypothetical protein